MLTIEKNDDTCSEITGFGRLRSAPISQDWNSSTRTEEKIHRIHAYPAKFPAFLVGAAFDYARSEGIAVSSVADVFCGCGTVAYETEKRGLEFWGCDINPVATLIARVKALNIDHTQFDEHVKAVLEGFSVSPSTPPVSAEAADRLSPWYDQVQFDDLSRLLNAIEAQNFVDDEYRMALRCAFSAIVKPSSRWGARSTKPAKDFSKTPPSVLGAFIRQCRFMSVAWAERGQPGKAVPNIVQGNVSTVGGPDAPVDLIVTSPPYVTSYEYADLHQLSALWLGFAEDHRAMRSGIIGTGFRRADLGRALKDLNPVATRIVFSLFDSNRSLAEAVAAYYLDMQHVTRRCHEFLRPGGLAVFVIGNTALHGVAIDNADHLTESLLNAGFNQIRAVRRVIANKANTPFRTLDGKFSGSPTGISIYGDEYILMAHR